VRLLLCMVEHVPAVVCQGPCFGAHHLVIIDVFVYERETIVLYEITCPLKTSLSQV